MVATDAFSTWRRSRAWHSCQIDFLDPAAPQVLRDMLGGGADVVLSDMAANATGHKKTDQLKIIALVEAAAEFAREVTRPGGSFLAKVLQGGTEGALLAQLKRDYATVRHLKPQASRADSSAELYLLAARVSRRLSFVSWMRCSVSRCERRDG